MNMFARFDENPAMILQDIKKTKRYGWTDGRTHGRTRARTDNVKTVYPAQTKFAGGGGYKNAMNQQHVNCPSLSLSRSYTQPHIGTHTSVAQERTLKGLMGS